MNRPLQRWMAAVVVLAGLCAPAQAKDADADGVSKPAGAGTTKMTTAPAVLHDHAPADDAHGTAGKTPAEVQKIIDDTGPTPPDWLEKTALEYPTALDLTYQRPNGKVQGAQLNYLPTYVWAVINENPAKWKGGIKLMYKVLEVNKDDEGKLNLSYQLLGRMYFNYFKDYARAAYYWQKAGNLEHFDQQHCADNVSLAHCYFALGDAAEARKILQAYPADRTGHGAIINAWSMFGDVTTALKMADATIESGNKYMGYSAGGDVCRRAGRYEEALKYYQGVLDIPKLPAQLKLRVREACDAIQYFNLFDLSKVPDGEFKGSATGYRGAVTSTVRVKNHKIVDVQISHREDQYYSSVTDIPAQIIAKQTVQGIDACSGATVTSNAILMGAAKAIYNGAPKSAADALSIP